MGYSAVIVGEPRSPDFDGFRPSQLPVASITMFVHTLYRVKKTFTVRWPTTRHGAPIENLVTVNALKTTMNVGRTNLFGG